MFVGTQLASLHLLDEAIDANCDFMRNCGRKNERFNELGRAVFYFFVGMQALVVTVFNSMFERVSPLATWEGSGVLRLKSYETPADGALHPRGFHKIKWRTPGPRAPRARLQRKRAPIIHTLHVLPTSRADRPATDCI